MHRKPFSLTLAVGILFASAAFAQAQYSVVLIDPQSPRDGSLIVAGFPVTGIPFSTAQAPSFPSLSVPPGWKSMGVLGYCNGAEVGYVSGQLQVGGASGGAQFSVPTHAIVWQAPLYLPGDLQNSMVESVATGCDGNVQVGSAGNGSGVSHAVMWFSSPKTQVDLHSGPYQSTGLNSINGNTQAGFGTLNRVIINGVEVNTFATHALIWHGTVKSLTDLHPAGFLDSVATQFGPSKEVGYADNITQDGLRIENAFVWSGTAASAFNLHQFVPPAYNSSQAYFLDVATGVISGTVSAVASGQETKTMIALWVPVQ